MNKDEKSYLFYIVKAPYDSLLAETRRLPGIFKIKGNDLNVKIHLTDPEEGEGPYNSLFELKSRSIIFRSVQLQKQRDRISKSNNIKITKDILLTQKDISFEKAFVDSFTHVTIGKISKKVLKGIHFYDPDFIEIIEKGHFDEKSGIWEARIRKKNENTGEWVEKSEMTTFFPDHWSVSKVFIESYIAYLNKKHDEGSIYYGRTKSGIKVKFIIDHEKKILSFYPVIV